MILFVDFDGVLNGRDSDWFGPMKPYVADPDKVKLLDELVKEIDCQVVVSSTWRLTITLEELNDRLGPEFMSRLHDNWKTGRDPSRLRGLEVRSWLKENGGLKQPYVILDDDTDFLWGQPLVHVNPKFGLDPFIYGKTVIQARYERQKYDQPAC